MQKQDLFATLCKIYKYKILRPQSLRVPSLWGERIASFEYASFPKVHVFKMWFPGMACVLVLHFAEIKYSCPKAA